MKLLKRTLAMLLVLTMVLGMVPFAAFAEETAAITLGTKPADGTVTGQPFNTAVSANYRIPGLVNHNGTLIATADARYDTEHDGGGSDIVVSRSKDGKNWNYTFPAYLGDNDNKHNVDSSTLMDPLIISNGTDLYLLYDMFPAGYSIGGKENTTYKFADITVNGTGFDANGRLRLGAYGNTVTDFPYYLENGKIYSANGEVADYTVDAWFNVYQNGTYVSNLFFADSPYCAFPTSYIAMQKSTDNGASWSDPQLLNIKDENALWEVLGPGSGLVTAKGELAFTAYDDTNIYLIHGKDNNWSVVKTPSATNESSIIELPNGDIRAFVKRGGNNTIAYVDFLKTTDGYTATALTDTGIPNFSNCMVSSLTYSRTLDGKDVVLVCCPSKSSGGLWGGRFNGKIFVFTLNEDNTMKHVADYAVNGEDAFFAYSNMAEKEDGTIALLYEDDCMKYSSFYDGDVSHISYTEIDLEKELGLVFDEPKDVFNWGSDNDTVEVQVPRAAGVTHMHTQPAEVNNMNVAYSAYEIVLCKDAQASCTGFSCDQTYTDPAQVTLALTDALKNATDVKGFVVNDDGSIKSVFDVEKDETHVTFEAPHFSVVGIAAMTEEEIAQQNTEEIALYVGENHTITLEGVALNGNSNSDFANVVWEGIASDAKLGSNSSFVGNTISARDCLYTFTQNTEGDAAGTWVIESVSNPGIYVRPRGGTATQPHHNAATNTTITENDYTGTTDGPFIFGTQGQGGSLHFHSQATDANNLYKWNGCSDAHSEDGNGTHGIFILKYTANGVEEVKALSELESGGQYLIAGKGGDGNYYLLHPTTSGSDYDHVAKYIGNTDDAVYKTTIAITGKTAGTTEVEINGVIYKINVKERIVQNIILTAGETETFTIADRAYSMDDVTTHPNGTYATLDSVVSTGPALVPVTAIESGKQYLIVNKSTGDVLTDTVVSVPGQWVNKTGLDTTGAPSMDSTELWTITGTEDSCTIVQNGKYLTIAGFYANMSDTVTNLTLEYTESGWTIYDDETTGNVSDVGTGGYYLSDSVGNNYTAGALGTNDTANTARYWDLYEVYPESITTVTFTGLAVGMTQAIVGNTQYNIIVTSDEMNEVEVELQVGETKDYTIDRAAYTDDDVIKAENADTVVLTSVDGNTVVHREVSTVPATEIKPGAKYVIATGRKDNGWPERTMIANPVKVDNNKYGIELVDSPSGEIMYWTIDAVDGGGYTISNGGNKLKIEGSNKASLATDAVVQIRVSQNNNYGNGYWEIYTSSGNTNYYLNYFNSFQGVSSSGHAASVYTQNDVGSQWKLYEVVEETESSTEITFTGKVVGTTAVIVGNTLYNITVTRGEMNEVEVELHVGETKTITDKTGNYTVSEAPAADIATVTVAGQDITETTVSTEKATVLESGATYVIKLAGTDKAMSNQAGSRDWGSETRALVSFNGQAAEEHVLWTLEPAQGGYKLKNGNGSYLQLTRNAAPLTADGHVFEILYDGGVWTFQNVDNKEYFNNLNGKNCIGGWSGNDTKFDLYKVNTAVTSNTEITFTGKTQGKTQAIVGNTQYNITVLPEDVREIVLHLGENKTFSILDHAYTMADVTTEPENYAVLNTLTSASPALTPVTAIESGKQYVFVNRGTGAVLTDRVITVTNNNQNPKTGLDTTTDSSAKTAELWTVTGADGSYTVSQNGKYLTVAGYHADMSTTATNLTLRYTEYGWLIYDTETKNTLGHADAGYYLDDSVETGYAGTALGTSIAGGKCSYWDICEVTPAGITEVVFTGVAVGGPTTAVIGHVTYNITVVQPEPKQVKVELYAGASETFIIENIQYTADNVTGPDGSGATLSVAPGTSGTEVTITGVTAGTTATAEVGHVTYTITVKDPKIRDIVLYESVVTRDVIAGQSYTNADTDQPDNTYAYIHSVANNGTDTEVVFSGVKAGTTEAVVGDVTYNITVKSLRSGNDIPDFNNIVGVDLYSDYNTNTSNRSVLDMAGEVIKSLRISEGASYRLGVDVTGYTDITWTSSDESIATVDAEGRVTAVKAGDTVITATVTKGDVTESISVCVKVVPSLVEGVDRDNITYIFYYMDQVHDTDAYYTLFLSSINQEGPVAGHEMVMVSEGEVIYIERPADAAMGWLWTADPWDDTALTLMGSTGSQNQYHPLQDENGNLGSGGNYYKESGNGQGYNNIVNLGQGGGANWQEALDKTLQYSIDIGKGFWNDPGCDGAMSNSRRYQDGTPGLVTSMSFVSDRLPELTKTVDGVLPIERKFDNYRRYTEGADMVATVGEQVYFKLTITMERPHIWKADSDTEAALQFADVVLSDTVLGDAEIAFFYNKDLDNLDKLWDGNVPDSAKTNVLNDTFAAAHDELQSLTEQLNAPWEADEEERVIELYLVYTIQSDDIYKISIDNTADLAYRVQSTYSLGATSGTADARVSIIVSGAMMDNVVIDFGQKFTYTGLTEDAIRGATRGEATYGDVDIDTENNTITYTPHSILQNIDVVYIYGMDAKTNQARVINSFSVYPATTVYYEEGFMLNDTDDSPSPWNSEGTAKKATMEQTFERLGVAEYYNGTLIGHTSDKQHPYGYDPMYKTDETVPGPSGGSYAAASAVGATTSFTFTGTGFDLYANCTLDTGYVAITLRDENGKVVKLYTVNTMVKPGITPETAGQIGDEYHLPIVSELNLLHGTYTVEVRKIVNDGNEVRLDGVRIYNTVENHTLFSLDVESNPTFFELRDCALTHLKINDSTSAKYGTLDQMSSQIYSALTAGGEAYTALITSLKNTKETVVTTETILKTYEDGGTSEEVVVTTVDWTYDAQGNAIEGEHKTSTPVITYKDKNDVVITGNNTSVVKEETKTTVKTVTYEQDMLDNSPKNELFLYPGQTLTFAVNTARVMQLGLKAPVATTAYSLSYYTEIDGERKTVEVATEATMNTSVDMFYSLGNTLGEYQTYTVSVTNTGGNILSVTKLKISDDPYAQMVGLEQEDIRQILLAAGYTAPEEETTPAVTTPEETTPAVTTPEESDPTEPQATKPAETDPTEPKVTEPENAFGCTKDIDCVLSQFTDADANEWYHDGVHFCVAEGLMNGMGEGIFAPNDPTTRAQLVTMLYRLMGNPKAEGKTEPFTDVAEGEWYYDAIVWAYSENVVKGISETEFAPNANVTREQVATILHRFLATPEGTGKLDSFSDAASVSTYAKDALVWAVGEGLINGVEQTNGKVLLDPTGTATRAQIATILYRYLENA